MRKTHKSQLTLTAPWLDLEPARELKAISDVLDEHPKINELVWQDLLGEQSPQTAPQGAEGLSAEQVLRALVLKQIKGLSYRALHFELHDSKTSQAFCRIGVLDKIPARSTLAAAIKSLRAETLEQVNRLLVAAAFEKKVETGRKVRVDCTVVESPIHPPTDSWLLWDCVRVLTRLMRQVRELLGPDQIHYHDRQRRAKRRYRGIENTPAEDAKTRRQLYRDLLRVSEEVVEMASTVRCRCAKVEELDVMSDRVLRGLIQELDRFLARSLQVIDQTRRRVLKDESVPASEKIVSIFEEHTDIICKDRRETYFGHKICLTGGQSSMILDCLVLDGNPVDSTLPRTMIERQSEIFDRPPRQAAFDGAFASKGNLKELKKQGVQDVAFSKKCGLRVSEMAKSPWVYRQLQRFRAGIEGNVSFLKRFLGLDRCTWRSLASFHSYVWGSIVACNLLILARHLLE